MANEKKTAKTYSSKSMIKEHGAKGTKVKYTDRLAVEILEDTQFYRKGQVIKPHKVKGEELVRLGIAKKYVPKEEN